MKRALPSFIQIATICSVRKKPAWARAIEPKCHDGPIGTPRRNKAILARNRCNITYLRIKPLQYHCSLISVSYSTTNVHHAKVSTVNCVCTDRTVSRSVLDYLQLAGKLTQQTRLPGRAVAYLSDHGQLHCRKPVRTTSTNPLRKRCYRSFGQTFITTPLLLLAPV